MVATNPKLVQAVVKAAKSLLGIHEDPDGSNANTNDPRLHDIQSTTGAYGAPWCVSTGQKIAKVVYGHTMFDASANAYYCASYSDKHGLTVPRPFAGGFVVYHIGQGHFGTVVSVHEDGTFDAIEGNEGNAVRLVHRDPKAIRCTFIVPKELRV